MWLAPSQNLLAQGTSHRSEALSFGGVETGLAYRTSEEAKSKRHLLEIESDFIIARVFYLMLQYRAWGAALAAPATPHAVAVETSVNADKHFAASLHMRMLV